MSTIKHPITLFKIAEVPIALLLRFSIIPMPCQGHGTTKDENRAEPPGDLGFYFRTNQSCHASGVTPPKMKIGTEGSEAYFRINSHAPLGRHEA